MKGKEIKKKITKEFLKKPTNSKAQLLLVMKGKEIKKIKIKKIKNRQQIQKLNCC